MKKNIQIVFDFVILVLLTLFDQFTKHLASTHLKTKGDYVLIKDVFELHYLENKGAAFGMLQGQKVFFVIVALVICVAFTYLLFRIPMEKKYIVLRICFVAIMAGAIGNMVDRLIYQYVVDFFYFKLINFPVFNVADIYVTVATALLILVVLFFYKEEDLEFLKREQK